MSTHRTLGEHRRRAPAFALLFALLFGALPAPAPAGPEGGKVVSGTADIVQTSPKRLDITQRSDKGRHRLAFVLHRR